MAVAGSGAVHAWLYNHGTCAPHVLLGPWAMAQLLKLNRPIAQLLNSSTRRLLPSRLDPLSCPLAAFTTLTFSPAPAASSAHSHLPGTDTSSAVPHPVLLNGPLALPPAPTLSLFFLPFTTFSVVPYCLFVPNPMYQYCIISPSVPAYALSVLASQHSPLFHSRVSVPADPSFPLPFAPRHVACSAEAGHTSLVSVSNSFQLRALFSPLPCQLL